MKLPGWMSRLQDRKPIVLGPRNRLRMPNAIFKTNRKNIIQNQEPLVVPKRKISNQKMNWVKKQLQQPLSPLKMPGRYRIPQPQRWKNNRRMIVPNQKPMASKRQNNSGSLYSVVSNGGNPLQFVLTRFMVSLATLTPLGAGTYNTVYLVKDNASSKQFALRISKYAQGKDLFELARAEMALSLDMSKKRIGPPVHRAQVFITSPKNNPTPVFFSAMLMDIMDSDLDHVLRNNPGHVKYDILARSLLQSIHALAKEGYLCADIKPANILIKGNQAYMADFDTNFCGKDSFLRKVCESTGLPNDRCALSPSDWKLVREIYYRAMILLLVRFLTVERRYPASSINYALANQIIQEFIKEKNPTLRPVMLAGKYLPVTAILQHALPSKITLFNVSKHYQGRNNFRGNNFTNMFKPFLQTRWGDVRKKALLPIQIAQQMKK